MVPEHLMKPALRNVSASVMSAYDAARRTQGRGPITTSDELIEDMQELQRAADRLNRAAAHVITLIEEDPDR